MAFLLKSPELIYTALRFTCKRSLPIKRGNFILVCPKVVNSTASSARTTFSVPVKQSHDENEAGNVDNLIFHLNKDIKYNNVFASDIEDVVNAIKQGGILKDAQLILLLKCCSESIFMATNQERIALAEKIWNTAENFGVKFDISHYNSLLSVFLNNEHKFSIKDFFEILKNKNIEPNYVTYKLALKAYCQQGDIEGASEILIKLRELNYVLKEEDFCSLILGYCEIGDFEKANELFNVMRNKGLIPKSGSYGTLLLGYAKHGKIEELKELLYKLNQDKILIGNSYILNIIYTLATNNYESHIDSFIEKLSPDAGNNSHTARIIQKLLHSRNDSVALKVFESSISPGLPSDGVLSRAKFIVKHFVLYRDSDEILDICKKIDEKGWSNSALSYALREVLLHKDEYVCLKFLSTMKKEGFEIRNHYYWPVIIKASKRNVLLMRSILKKLPRSLFKNSYETTHKVIFPNITCKDNSDFDFLYGLGISKRLLNFCFFESHLLKRNLSSAENIATKEFLTTKRWKHTVNCIISAFTHDTSNDKSFLNTLHGFSHDYYYVRTFLKENSNLEDFDENDKMENIFEYAILRLIKLLKKEDVITRVLEGMLERKMGISSKTANVIASSFQSQKIDDLAKKLAGPEAKFECDKDLLRTKIWQLPQVVFSLVSDSAKDLVLNPSTSASSLAEKVSPETSVTDSMFFAVVLGHRGAKEEAFTILEKLASRNSETLPNSAIHLFKYFLIKQASHSAKVVFQAMDLGSKMGISSRSRRAILKDVIDGSCLRDAAFVFTEKVSRYKDATGVLPLMIRAAKERDYKVIHYLKESLIGHYDGNLLSNYHAIALATAGQVERAKWLLDAENVDLRQRLFYTHCEFYYPNSTATVYENYLELVKNLKNFDRAPLYKLLMRKYAASSNVKKALLLCTTIEEDEIPDYTILKEIPAFKANPTHQNLLNLAKSLQKEFIVTHEKSDHYNSEPGITQSNSTTYASESDTLSSLRNDSPEPEHIGTTKNFYELLNEYPTLSSKKCEKTATALLQNNKVEEFFQLLEENIQNGKFNYIIRCFNIKALLPHLEDNKYFQKYKDMALKCLEEGYISTPLIPLFVICVITPTKLPVAESLVKQYASQFRNIPFLEICEEAKVLGSEMKFYENFVSSETLKSNFREYHHIMYNKLIKHYCINHNLTSALHYLEMAVSNSAEKLIDKDIINLLDQKLRETGESFPHPELLSTPSMNC